MARMGSLGIAATSSPRLLAVPGRLGPASGPVVARLDEGSPVLARTASRSRGAQDVIREGSRIN